MEILGISSTILLGIIFLAFVLCLALLLIIFLYEKHSAEKSNTSKSVYNKKIRNGMCNCNNSHAPDIKRREENCKNNDKKSSDIHKSYEDEKINYQSKKENDKQNVVVKKRSAIGILIEDYNYAVNNRDSSSFKQKYRNRIRIGVKNTEERLLNPEIIPVFTELDSGNFWAIDVDRRLIVIPKLEMTLLESHHGPGAMGYVFKYKGFDPGKKYSSLIVLEPALFVRDNLNFTQLHRGTLDIGEGVNR